MIGVAVICEIARIIHPGKKGHRYMMVFTFKFDESYKGARTMMVAGWVAEEGHWRKVHRRWCNALAYENKTLPEGRKISRYHAAEMNANGGEYVGWKNETCRKLRFTKKLLRLVGKAQMTAVGCGLDLKAFFEVFPEQNPKDLSGPYVLCIKQLMTDLAFALEDVGPDARVALIHDHGDWDKDALAGYNVMVDDQTWPRRHRFVSITPLTWREDVGLQSADLFAYEAMRHLDDKLEQARHKASI
jgi:hypothetical protein